MVKVTFPCYWVLVSRLWNGPRASTRIDGGTTRLLSPTKVDPKQQPSRRPRGLWVAGGALCHSKRLDEDHACEQGEKRLHRALQALMAQDPARCGAFLFRAASLFDVAVSDAFAARCPDEACVWGLRLAVCRFQLKTEDLRTSDCLRRALSGLGGTSPKVTTVRLARLAEALGQVATTPDAARRFLDSVDDADAAFARERLLALRAASASPTTRWRPRRRWSRPTTSRRARS